MQLAAGRKAHGGEGAREALRGIQCVGHNIIVCRSARYAWVRVRFAFRLKGGECPVAGRHAQCEAGGRWEGSDEAAGVEVAGRRWSREKPRWRRSAKPSLAHPVQCLPAKTIWRHLFLRSSTSPIDTARCADESGNPQLRDGCISIICLLPKFARQRSSRPAAARDLEGLSRKLGGTRPLRPSGAGSGAALQPTHDCLQCHRQCCTQHAKSMRGL